MWQRKRILDVVDKRSGMLPKKRKKSPWRRQVVPTIGGWMGQNVQGDIQELRLRAT